MRYSILGRLVVLQIESCVAIPWYISGFLFTVHSQFVRNRNRFEDIRDF
jgi:hypothetical protein